MVREETALVPAHAEVVREEGTGGGGVVGGVEAAVVGLEDVSYVAVEVADFPGYAPDEVRLIGGEVGKGLGSFGMLNLGREGIVSGLEALV